MPNGIPKLPKGFVLVQPQQQTIPQQQALPPLPQGFVLQQSSAFGLEKATGIGAQPSLIKRLPRMAYREIVAPMLHGGSTFALGIPRAIAGAISPVGERAVFPEQRTLLGKAIRLPAEIAGFATGGAARGGQLLARGAMKAAPRLAGRGLLSAAGRGAIRGAGMGLLQTPITGEGILRPQERLAQAGQWGALGAIVPPIGRGISKTVRGTGSLIRAIGGVSRETVNQVRRLGYTRIVDPIKRQAGYIGNVLVPQVKQAVNTTLDKFSSNTQNLLSKLGVSQNAITNLRQSGYKNLRNLWTRLQGNTDTLTKRAQEGVGFLKSKASQQYGALFNKQVPLDAHIKPSGMYNYLRNELEKLGAVDRMGNVIGGRTYPSTTINNLVRIYQDLQQSLVPTAKRQITGMLGKSGYIRFRTALDAAPTGDVPAVNRIAYKAASLLRRDAANRYGFLKQANQAYAQASKLEEEYATKLKETFLRRYGRLTLSQRKWLQNLENQLPPDYKFMKDLRNFHSIEEINKALQKNFSDKAIESSLTKFSAYERGISVEQNAVRNLYRHLPKGVNITDDALSHYLGNDIFQEKLSSGFMGAAGLTRAVSEAAVRAYLKAYPGLRGLQQRTIEPVMRGIRANVPLR